MDPLGDPRDPVPSRSTTLPRTPSSPMLRCIWTFARVVVGCVRGHGDRRSLSNVILTRARARGSV
jgi:hypothetical protein